MSDLKKHPALEEHEVVIHVPKGTKDRIKVQEEAGELPAEITVRVSKKRKSSSSRPVLGVIVK